MPPRKGESQRDKALRHKRMAAEYNRKARFTRLMDLLSKREDLLYKVEEHLIDSGDMDEFVPTGMERRDSKPLLAIGDEEHVEDESDRVDAAVMSTPLQCDRRRTVQPKCKQDRRFVLANLEGCTP